MLSNLGRKSEAKTYATRLTTFLKPIDELYYVDGAKTSITSSQGKYLQIESTSVAILAWMPFQSDFSEELETSIKTLVQSV